MQPYFFPYVGYFQLINAVDVFVFFDDVNYIKKGWINRNHILGNHGRQRITLALTGASQNKLINEIETGEDRSKLLKTIKHTYSKASEFSRVFPLLESIIVGSRSRLDHFLEDTIMAISSYLDLEPVWKTSSALEYSRTGGGQEKILSICEVLGAKHYINVPGGRELYDPRAFINKGFSLSFIAPQIDHYQQFSKPFEPGLSIIDLLMFNDPAAVREMLGHYRLETVT